MKEFVKSLEFVIIPLIVYWCLNIVIDEKFSAFGGVLFLIDIALLIALAVIYLVKEKMILEKYNLNKVKFNILLVIVWAAIGFLSSLGIFLLIEQDILNGMGGFLSGIEYIIFAFALVIPPAILIIWKIIYKIICVCRKSSKDYEKEENVDDII